jgi:hypothetical protein
MLCYIMNDLYILYVKSNKKMQRAALRAGIDVTYAEIKFY